MPFKEQNRQFASNSVQVLPPPQLQHIVEALNVLKSPVPQRTGNAVYASQVMLNASTAPMGAVSTQTTGASVATEVGVARNKAGEKESMGS